MIRLDDDEIRRAKAEAVRLSWAHKAHPSYEKDKFLLDVQLKKVHDKIEAMMADGYWIDDVLEALLKEIE